MEEEATQEMFTYKIWNIKHKRYETNGNWQRAKYDCFPEESVKKIAGRLCGKGNYQIQKFKLERVEL